MKLYNTLTKKVENVTPLDGKVVRIYSCGPTVYDHAHVGNLSAYIFADTLHRALVLDGKSVRHAMNYTDVDDKTIRRSREKYPDKVPREALHELTNRFIDVFLNDMRAIGNRTDDAWITFMRATDNIEAMQTLIAKLHASGFAYIAGDGVYFSIEAYRRSGKTYGQLLEISASNTSEARIQNDEYDKESAHDFALWKQQKDGEPAWEFTLGGREMRGRPGWHIECSAMSKKSLAQPFDIHTGGVDLIFPHHENEIAQSTAGEPNPIMASIFAHNEHILIDGKKMAKSAQNFYTLEDVLNKGYDPLAFRLMILQAHYRSQVNFTWESLEAAQHRLNRFRNFAVRRFQEVQPASGSFSPAIMTLQQFEIDSAIADDLDIPQALAAIEAYMTYVEENDASLADEKFLTRPFLEKMDAIFGLDLMQQTDISAEQKQLIQDRKQSRADKNWVKSDELRVQLARQGIGVRDSAHGSIWFRL